MPAAPQELPIEQAIIKIFEDTHNVLAESREKLPVRQSGTSTIQEAAAHLSAASLASLALDLPFRDYSPEELVNIQLFNAAKSTWIEEKKEIQPNEIADVSRSLYIAAQNTSFEELVRDSLFTVSRQTDSTDNALFTQYGRGYARVEGPVTGQLVKPKAEFGIFTIIPGGDSPELGHFVTFLDPNGVVQLDLKVEGAAAPPA